MVEAIDPRSINSTISDLINPMGANESQMYDSIDSGLKDDLNFDEIITFAHTFSKFRVFQALNFKIEEFPYLTNNEYLLAGNLNFDEKSLSTMNNKEILQLVKSRVNSYISDGDINFKCLFLDNITNYAIEIGFESTVDLLIPLMAKIPDERDSVKIKFLQVVKSFVDFLIKNGEEGYKLTKDQIIPVLSDTFQDKKNPRVIELCCDALVEITKYIRDEDKGSHILTIVIIMAHDDSDEESRVLAAKLFNQLAIIIGRELCELYVVPQIASFADDPHSKVRKAVAGNFLNMCQSVSENIFRTKLLPVYQKLAKDSLWIVRKAATEILPKITSLCNSETVSTTLLEIFRNFTNDSQKYVRIAAIEVLGQFIALLKQEDLTTSILEFYIQIVREFYDNKDSGSSESDIIYHCAYNFPAVLHTFGREYWNDLRDIYFKMAGDREYRVRKSIASSLSEIGKILGPELTESQLTIVFDKLYKEEGEIQNTLLKILPHFLKDLSKTNRRNYLDKIKRFLNPREKWRTRIEFSAIIGEYNNVFDDEISYKQLLPVGIYFCIDDVAEVRFAAAQNVSKIILQLLCSETEYRQKTIKIVDCFAHSIHYNYRQLFALMCTDLFQNEAITQSLAINNIQNLVFDRVVNVRVTLAKVISGLFKEKSIFIIKLEYEWVLKNQKILRIAYKLKKDLNKNVSSQFENIDIEECFFSTDVDSNPNHLFTNKMELLREEFGISKNLPLHSSVNEKKIVSPKKKEFITETKEEITTLKTIHLDTGSDMIVDKEESEAKLLENEKEIEAPEIPDILDHTIEKTEQPDPTLEDTDIYDHKLENTEVVDNKSQNSYDDFIKIDETEKLVETQNSDNENMESN